MLISRFRFEDYCDNTNYTNNINSTINKNIDNVTPLQGCIGRSSRLLYPRDL